MTSYEELESERHFAETAYQQALQALDRARREAERQRIYLVPFVRPSLPEESLYPRRPMAIGIVFLAAFAVWAIGSLVVQSIRDHL
jgi:capsular polysaccharide transport system permease protein